VSFVRLSVDRQRRFAIAYQFSLCLDGLFDTLAPWMWLFRWCHTSLFSLWVGVEVLLWWICWTTDHWTSQALWPYANHWVFAACIGWGVIRCFGHCKTVTEDGRRPARREFLAAVGGGLVVVSMVEMWMSLSRG